MANEVTIINTEKNAYTIWETRESYVSAYYCFEAINRAPDDTYHPIDSAYMLAIDNAMYAYAPITTALYQAIGKSRSDSASRRPRNIGTALAGPLSASESSADCTE
jgi:hypothetical protein